MIEVSKKKSFYDEAVEYLRFKHVFDGIRDINILIDFESDYKEVIVNTDKDSYSYVIIKYLKDDIFKTSLENKKIVTKDCKENRNFLIKKWSEFIKVKNLIVYFISMRGHEPTMWSINPFVHNQLMGTKNLNRVISSLASKKS